MSGSKIAVITGGGTGVGKAAALALMKAGWDVALAGRRKEPLEAVAKEGASSGRKAIAVQTDVADPNSVKALFAEVEKTFGRLDLLFNNAGIGAPGADLEELPFEKWKSVVDINLTGAFLCAQQAFRIMKTQIAARRAHHQQRLDLGACTASEFGRLYVDETRDHRIDEVDLARWSQIRHRLRPDRYRQRRRPIWRARMADGVPQADGSIKVEPLMDLEHVGDAVVFMAGLPLQSNVQFLTIMATKMPFVGRG